jgi:hypothetical protein
MITNDEYDSGPEAPTPAVRAQISRNKNRIDYNSLHNFGFGE